MNLRLLEHGLTVLLVSLVLALVVTFISRQEAERLANRAVAFEPYLHLDGVDLGDPLHRTLFRETLGIFYPGRTGRNDSLIEALERFRQEEFAGTLYKSGGEERGLSGTRLRTLGNMVLQFFLVYLVVIVVTYRAAQSIAIFRFVKIRQGRGPYLAGVADWLHRPGLGRLPAALASLLLAMVKGAVYAVLFAPAYVIAYSLRTGLHTDSLPFLMLLGTVSNGLLIGAANRFSTFLTGESRKGYVQTMLVKNLDASYAWHGLHGVSPWAVLHPGVVPGTHVFRQIYRNARYHFLPSMKEHATFLVTGLIIIEMALNIQGHLGYELLRSILYREYDVAAAIVLGIFLIVKLTEIAVDVWVHREAQRYGETR